MASIDELLKSTYFTTADRSKVTVSNAGVAPLYVDAVVAVKGVKSPGTVARTLPWMARAALPASCWTNHAARIGVCTPTIT